MHKSPTVTSNSTSPNSVQDDSSGAVRLLVVSREPSILRFFWGFAQSNSWQVETVGSGWVAIERVHAGPIPHLLVLHSRYADDDTFHILRWLRRLCPKLRVVLLGAPDILKHRGEPRELCAADLFVSPFEPEHLERAIRRQLASAEDERIQYRMMSADVEQLSDDYYFVNGSPAAQRLRTELELLGRSNSPALIVGEPGSGRNTAARLIHKLSTRCGFRFLKVNCEALSNELFEKDLFSRQLELCNRGTIYLDEVEKMPIRLQETLLCAIREKKISKPSTGACIDVDARVLASSDTDLEHLLRTHRLRQDLYDLLSALTVHVPSLRERSEDIPFLLQHLMHKLSRLYDLPMREFPVEMISACRSYLWPGNVRELESFVQRYLTTGNQQILQIVADEIPLRAEVLSWRSPQKQFGGDSVQLGGHERSLKSLVTGLKSEAERNAISAALRETGWNRKAAAKLLKVSYRTILYKIDYYHINPFEATPFSTINQRSR